MVRGVGWGGALCLGHGAQGREVGAETQRRGRSESVAFSPKYNGQSPEV